MEIEAAAHEIPETELHKPAENAISHSPIKFEEFTPVLGSQSESALAKERIKINRSRPVSSVQGENKNLSRVTR